MLVKYQHSKTQLCIECTVQYIHLPSPVTWLFEPGYRLLPQVRRQRCSSVLQQHRCLADYSAADGKAKCPQGLVISQFMLLVEYSPQQCAFQPLALHFCLKLNVLLCFQHLAGKVLLVYYLLSA